MIRQLIGRLASPAVTVLDLAGAVSAVVLLVVYVVQGHL